MVHRTDGAGEALRTGAFYSKARPVTQHVSLRFQKKTSSGYKIGKRSAGVPFSHNSRASWKHKKGIKGILPFIVAFKGSGVVSGPNLTPNRALFNTRLGSHQK